MQIRPVFIFILTLVITAGACLLTLHDLKAQAQADAFNASLPKNNWIEISPEYLFVPEITHVFQDGDRSIVVIRETTENPVHCGPVTLYLRTSGNAAKSAAYFPQLTGTSEVWSYAAFDNTSPEDAAKAQMEYGIMPISYLVSEDESQEWAVYFEQQDRIIKGWLPTDAMLENPSYRVMNILFFEGDTVVFADTLTDEVELGSPMTFTYEVPFNLPAFDRIEVRTV
ncbi:hypothetical protein [Faecalibaculum rodentium]|uniref:hypothetical protein n=1 Tax=Faecalibaculum rodentium TaxID=1702221 RepID=UPI0023F1B73E|nr:hypothetical protein [Faecalibaculum rodentium]